MNRLLTCALPAPSTCRRPRPHSASKNSSKATASVPRCSSAPCSPARNRGIKHMQVCCLMENQRMQHLARKFEAEITFDFGSSGRHDGKFATDAAIAHRGDGSRRSQLCRSQSRFPIEPLQAAADLGSAVTGAGRKSDPPVLLSNSPTSACLRLDCAAPAFRRFPVCVPIRLLGS